MDPYAIPRRHGWPSHGGFATAAERSAALLDEKMPERVRFIRSYVLDEGDGARRAISIYEAPSLKAIREHAARAGLSADRIVPITDTVFVPPDPM